MDAFAVPLLPDSTRRASRANQPSSRRDDLLAANKENVPTAFANGLNNAQDVPIFKTPQPVRKKKVETASTVKVGH